MAKVNKDFKEYSVNLTSPDLTREELEAMRKRMAIRANSALTRLRKHTEQTGDYSAAQSKAEQYLLPRERKYFRISDSPADMTTGEIREEAVALRNFLTERTATVTGVKEEVTATQEMLREYMGDSFDVKLDNHAYNFMSDIYFHSLSYMMGSDQIVDFIHTAEKAGIDQDTALRRAFAAVADNTGTDAIADINAAAGTKTRPILRVRDDVGVLDLYRELGIDFGGQDNQNDLLMRMKQKEWDEIHEERTWLA